MMTVKRTALVLLALLGTACGAEDGQPIETVGSWESDFGPMTISETMWDTAEIIEFDNSDNWAITQNSANDEYSPNTFNKLVWTSPVNNSFYFCTVDFGLDSQAAAQDSTKTADDSDPMNSGCGDFPWSALTLAE